MPYIASDANSLILLRSCSNIALVRAPLSIRPSNVSLLNPSEKNTYDAYISK